MRTTIFTLSALVLATGVIADNDTTTPSGPNQVIGVPGTVKPNSYIVKLNDGTDKTDHLRQLAKYLNHGSVLGYDYEPSFFNGYSAILAEDALDALQASRDVAYIIVDSEVRASRTIQQTNAPWGLQVISQPEQPLDTSSPTSLTYSYAFDSSAGSSVDIYIIDTGINVAHQDFQGRAKWGAVFGGYKQSDGNGHGTHCAGTAASLHYGVAKRAHLIAVKVLSDKGSGWTSDIIAGINWVAQQVNSNKRSSVISMSLGGSANQALDEASTNAVNLGIHVVVAAGNSNQDAGTSSPAEAPGVFTVGASDINGARAVFSNYGPVVDIFAPGVQIVSTWIGSKTAINTLSGTSMATPLVAGLVAYLTTLEGVRTPSDMAARLQDLALDNILSNIPPSTINKFAQNGISSRGQNK